eukprot:XP_001704170.1 Hypothetical protein GL50803_18998 [Giardia lamblia ATCC 50803]
MLEIRNLSFFSLAAIAAFVNAYGIISYACTVENIAPAGDALSQFRNHRKHKRREGVHKVDDGFCLYSLSNIDREVPGLSDLPEKSVGSHLRCVVPRHQSFKFTGRVKRWQRGEQLQHTSMNAVHPWRTHYSHVYLYIFIHDRDAVGVVCQYLAVSKHLGKHGFGCFLQCADCLGLEANFVSS